MTYNAAQWRRRLKNQWVVILRVAGQEKRSKETLVRVLGLRTVGDRQSSMTEPEQNALYLCTGRTATIGP